MTFWTYGLSTKRETSESMNPIADFNERDRGLLQGRGIVGEPGNRWRFRRGNLAVGLG